MAATSRGSGSSGTSRPAMGQRRGPMGRHGAFERPKDARGTVARLAAYLRPYIAQLSVVVVLEILNSAMAVLGPFLMGLAIDALSMPDATTRLPRVMAIMAGSYAGAWITQLGQAYIMAGVAQTALKAMRRDLFAHLQRLSLRYFDQHAHGDLMSRLTNDIDAISRVLSQSVTQFMTSVLTLIAILVVMFVTNLWLTLVTLLVIPLMFMVTMTIARKVRDRFRALQGQLGDLNGQMEETVSGAKEIQAFHQQEAAVASFARLNA